MLAWSGWSPTKWLWSACWREPWQRSSTVSASPDVFQPSNEICCLASVSAAFTYNQNQLCHLFFTKERGFALSKASPSSIYQSLISAVSIIFNIFSTRLIALTLHCNKIQRRICLPWSENSQMRSVYWLFLLFGLKSGALHRKKNNGSLKNKCKKLALFLCFFLIFTFF